MNAALARGAIGRGSRRFLRGHAGTQHSDFTRVSRIAAHCEWIVRCFYLTNLWLVAARLDPLRSIGLSDAPVDLLWPVEWIAFLGLDWGVVLITHFAILAAVWALIWPGHLYARIGVFVSQLLMAAIANSFGSIGHPFHAWVWVSLALVFAPLVDREKEAALARRLRVQLILAISLAQGLFLLFYSMAGFAKIVYALDAWSHQRVGGFSPEAFALTLANRSTETGTQPVWAPLLIRHPLLGYPLYLGAMYVEVASLLIWLRPRLHRLWGVCLIGLHIGANLTMEISFPQNVLLAGLLLVMSPFWRPTDTHARSLVWDLPLVALLRWGYVKRQGRLR